MAEITDVQVVAFSNGEIRNIADRMFSTYFKAKEVLQDYNSENIGTLINNAGSSNLIADGSLTDGRPRITGGAVFNVITALQQFVNYMEGVAVTTADRRDVFTTVHVNRVS